MIVLQELRKVVETGDKLISEINKLEEQKCSLESRDILHIVLEYQHCLYLDEKMMSVLKSNLLKMIDCAIAEKTKELEELIKPYDIVINCDKYVDTDSIFTYTRDGKEITYKEWLNAIYGGK